MESNGALGLGAAANMVELETHECFHQCAFPISLMTHHQHRGGLEWGLELLS